MATSTIERQAKALADRQYTFTLSQYHPGDPWTSTVLEFPGVISEGADPNEAIEMAREALGLMIELRLEEGRDVPEPLETREFSGRLQLRLNPELHRLATTRAAHENVSLNRWLAASIARSTGIATPTTSPTPPPATPALALVAEESEDYGPPSGDDSEE